MDVSPELKYGRVTGIINLMRCHHKDSFLIALNITSDRKIDKEHISVVINNKFIPSDATRCGSIANIIKCDIPEAANATKIKKIHLSLIGEVHMAR